MFVATKTNEKVVKDWRSDPRAAKKFQFFHHFLPHPEAQRRSLFLSPRSLILYCITMVVLAVVFRVIPTLFPSVLGYATNINVIDLLSSTNKSRTVGGLKTLTLNKTLSAAAQKKAEHMFKNNYWAHIAPDGTEPWDFILGEDYDYIYAGENLAKNFSTSGEVVKAWENSPSHRENLLNTNYTEIGFAVLDGKLNGYETTLVVQMFGKPRHPSQLATVDTNELIKTDSSAGAKNGNPNAVGQPAPSRAENVLPGSSQGSVKPLMDVRLLSKGFVGLLGLFLVTLLAADIWYSSRKGIVKLTGHTWVHISFLIVALVGIWFVINPGRVI